MNKVILMGRLTRDPEIRYTNSSEPLAITRYSIAVNRRFKREGEPDADFINCVAFGKSGEFANNYFRKGMMVSVVGNLRVNSWDDQSGQKRYSTDVVIEEQHFAESKKSYEANHGPMSAPSKPVENNMPEDFSQSNETDDDLPF
ncbi:MAG: single-stranded DNA-binding protein [Lachnospirales bacterium]